MNCTSRLNEIDELLVTVPLYDMDQPSKGLSTDASVAYNNFSRGPNKPHVTVSDQMAVFAQLESAVRFEAGHKKAQETIPEVAKRYQSLLSNILFLDPVPARMREYSFTNDKRLLGDGTNLSSVLFRLWGSGDDFLAEPFLSQRAAILEFIQSPPEQDIAGLSFLDGPRGEVMVQLLETFGGTPTAYDASLVGWHFAGAGHCRCDALGTGRQSGGHLRNRQRRAPEPRASSAGQHQVDCRAPQTARAPVDA